MTKIIRNGIGSSEIGAIAGLCPYSGPLKVYANILGITPEIEDNEDMYWGREFEEKIAKRWNRDRGLQLTQGTLFYDTECPWRRATPDFLIHDGDKTAILECKTVGGRVAWRWGDEDDATPEEYLAQVAWQLGLSLRAGIVNQEYVYIGALFLATKKYREYRYDRDIDFENSLFAIGDNFWLNHIEKRVPPAADSTSLSIIKMLHPRNVYDFIEATEDTKELIKRFSEAKKSLKVVKKQHDDLEAKVKQIIGGHMGIREMATWKNNKSRNETDWEAVAKEIGANEEVIKKHTKEVPGARVLRVNWKGEK